MLWLVGLAATAVALLAVAARRREPWTVRIAGLAAVLVALFASTDRMRLVPVEAVPHLVAVTTGNAPLDDLEARLAASVVGPRFDRVVASGGGIDAALAVTATRFDPAEVEVALIWTDSFDPATFEAPSESRALSGVRAFTARTAAPLEPGDVEVRSYAPLRADRPAALEVRTTRALPLDAVIRVQLRDPDGVVVGSVRLDAEDLRSGDAGGKPYELAVEPQSAGIHRVDVQVTAGGFELTAAGTVAVGPPPSIGAIGAGAEVVAAALRAQGLDARVLASLEATDSVGVVVALDPLEVADQRRLVEFVDRGGGLFVGGGGRGSSLPQAGQPLHDLLPVEVLLQPEIESEGDAAVGSGRGDKSVEDPAAPGEPGPKPDSKSEDPDSGEAAVGDVEGAEAPDPAAPKAEVERRTVALVLVVDRSGSMSELVNDIDTRMDFAKKSAEVTARELAADDLLGIVAFDSRPQDVLPIGPRPAPAELRRRLAALRAGGGTRMQPGLERAGDWLIGARAAVKHVVLITDGDRKGQQGADPERTKAAALQLRRRGITVSVLHVSKPGDDVRFALYDDIASLGGGAFYRTRDGSKVPRLLLTEVRRVLGGVGRGNADSGEPGAGGGQEKPKPDELPPPENTEPPPSEPESEDPEVDEPESQPPPEGAQPQALEVRAVSDSRLVEPYPPRGYPTVGGVAAVAGRADAQTLFVAGDDGIPLLAFANRGLGRVGVWCADLVGDWSDSWRGADDFPARLGQWISYLLPPRTGPIPGSLCDPGTLTPAAPTRAELAALAARSGGEVALLLELGVPRPRRVERAEGRALDDALLALGAAFLLAIVEFIARRL